MAEDSDLEKTEQPSQRRLDQAREEGQAARSARIVYIFRAVCRWCRAMADGFRAVCTTNKAVA